MIRRSTLLVAFAGPAACSAPPPIHPNTAGAPLSLAADAQMVTIPAGQFVAGSTPEERATAYDDFLATSGKDTAREHAWFDGEDDRHVEHLLAYRIDLMPVTQSEYAELVLAGGVRAPAIDEAAWKAQGLAQDYATVVSRFVWKDNLPPPSKLDHPVVLVTYDEAAAYCAWRGAQRGEPRRLPTAAEYEKAARGAEGLAYPWGNTYDPDKLDSAVKGPGDTIAVGELTTGASAYGVLGMAGNAFEWTSTPFSGTKRTVKGSAFEDYGGVGRGAGRHGRTPNLRAPVIGFRCAADAPAPP
ncbi:MAG: SUMF1/EgtB/PvdO family nonheme iron enzyme [Kofleriaceae bacterium]